MNEQDTPQPAGTEFNEQELYSPEVLESATEELSRLTPEAYLQFMDYVHGLEESEKLPEAGGTVWANIYGKSGLKLNLTVRGSDPIITGEKLLRALIYFRDKYGFSFVEPRNAPPVPSTNMAPPESYPVEPGQPMRQEPTYVTPSGQPAQPGPSIGNVGGDANYVTIEVTSVKHVKTLDGKGDYVRAMGGKYTKFGVPAYDEVVPQGIQYKLWPVDTPYNAVPPQMKFMQVEVIMHNGKEKTKVVGFSPHA